MGKRQGKRLKRARKREIKEKLGGERKRGYRRGRKGETKEKCGRDRERG